LALWRSQFPEARSNRAGECVEGNEIDIISTPRSANTNNLCRDFASTLCCVCDYLSLLAAFWREIVAADRACLALCLLSSSAAASEHGAYSRRT